jgi:hypothetical protein
MLYSRWLMLDALRFSSACCIAARFNWHASRERDNFFSDLLIARSLTELYQLLCAPKPVMLSDVFVAGNNLCPSNSFLNIYSFFTHPPTSFSFRVARLACIRRQSFWISDGERVGLKFFLGGVSQ